MAYPSPDTEPRFDIRTLSRAPGVCDMLASLLIETVAHGGSVSFMHPLDPVAAQTFWDDAFAAAARGDRVVLGAWEGDVLVGTVTLLLKLPPNQPHRAEISKLMTRVSHRGRGIAAALMRAAEAQAAAKSRTLLVLDTAAEDGASGFYEKLGYTLSGIIPDYALKPHGGLTATMVYWKRIGAQ